MWIQHQYPSKLWTTAPEWPAIPVIPVLPGWPMHKHCLHQMFLSSCLLPLTFFIVKIICNPAKLILPDYSKGYVRRTNDLPTIYLLSRVSCRSIQFLFCKINIFSPKYLSNSSWRLSFVSTGKGTKPLAKTVGSVGTVKVSCYYAVKPLFASFLFFFFLKFFSLVAFQKSRHLH
jgi:hypothetical protein